MTFDEVFDDLDARLERIEQTARGPLAWLMRRRARKARAALAAYRAELAERALRQVAEAMR